MTTGVIVGGSNVTSNMNTRRRHFLHFGMIGANPFRGFRAFGGNNNNSSLRNNNNNNLSLLLLPRFRRGLEGGLGGGFNLLPGENVKELDPNVAALVNALTGANLEINYVERKSNHVKLTEFGKTKAEDPNE